MSEPLVKRTDDRRPWGPREWIVVGLLLIAAAGIVAGATGEDGNGPGIFALAAIPGSLMVTIGTIAKGVQVGLRSSSERP